MRKVCFLFLAGSLLMPAGCSAADMMQICEDKVGEHIQQISDIEANEDYIQYISLAEEGKLDEEGRYNELGEYEAFTADRNLPESPEDTADRKQVHITFAANGYLTVRYYYDADLKEPIETDFCYLDPGESIYAPQPESRNPYTNSYVFSEFRIYGYDSDGSRSRIPGLSGRDSSVLTIPKDFIGTELSVEPVGEYQRRIVAFDAYTIDKNGNHKAVIGGVWKVNDEQYADDTAELSPSDAYIIRYCYNSEEYYVVDSEPAFYSDNGGVVEFPRTTSMDKEDSYSVQLHPYGSAVLEGDPDGIRGISAVKVNQADYYGEYPIEDTEIRKLKAGDRILIETSDEYRLFCPQMDIHEETPGGGVYRYSFTMPDSNETIRLRVGKSALKVSVAGNVGNKVLFDIETDGTVKRDCVYEKQSFGRDCIIFDGNIGIEEAVSISVKGGSLPADHALRMDIVREDSNGNETEEIAYITVLPGSWTIDVYKDGRVDNFGSIYKSIDIEIELVETMVYRQTVIENASVTVRYSESDESMELKEGEIVEASREVDVVIEPYEGYYVSGKKVDGDSYKSSMSFKKYVSDIEEIIESHPVKRYIQVTFDASDEHGECVFRLDGEEVGGNGVPETVILKEGQKVTLEYSLTDSDYRILRESGGILGGIKDWGASIFSKNKASSEIEITEELDGATVTRESYIKLDKK